jgi:hypothetical protein
MKEMMLAILVIMLLAGASSAASALANVFNASIVITPSMGGGLEIAQIEPDGRTFSASSQLNFRAWWHTTGAWSCGAT